MKQNMKRIQPRTERLPNDFNPFYNEKSLKKGGGGYSYFSAFAAIRFLQWG